MSSTERRACGSVRRVRSVLAYGDSNTHGTVPMRHAHDLRRYDREIRSTGHAAACLPKDVHIIEEGHPGRTTLHDDPIEGAHKNGLTVLPALLETHRPLEAVVLMLGTNDMKARFPVTAMDVARAVERLAMVVIGSGAGPDLGCPKLLIVAPPPIQEVGCLAEMFQGGAARSHRLGAAMAAMASRTGISFVDAGQHITVSPTDGIHFEPEAHAVLGRTIGAALARLLD